jgi:predicted alpha/beta-fold hydrolase
MERITLDDGDFVDLAWLGRDIDLPQVLLLHGLEGSVDSPYVKGLMQRLHLTGFVVCFMHFRGCSGVLNDRNRSYHSGDTGDFQQVINHMQQQGQREVYAVIGFSLGGNVLLKWLGEQAENAPIQRAVAVSVPFVLRDAAERMNRGFSRLYQHHLLSRLHKKYQEKFSRQPSPLKVNVTQLTTFFRFDDQVTAPLHGFNDVDDYYRRASSRQYIPEIKVPTLLIHASDDPFMFPTTAPEAHELPAVVTLELSVGGGHVGFVTGRWPWQARYWVDERIVSWLCEE